MTPAETIAGLDRALADAGEEVVLRRIVGTAPNTVNIDVACRALVRTFRLRTEQLASGISQSDWLLTLSPSEIATAQWPGGTPVGGSTVDPTIPAKLDRVVLHGVPRTINQVDPIYVEGVLVRLDMHVLG